MLHGKGHAGAITSTEALIANAEHYERVPLAQHGTNQHSEPEGQDVFTTPPVQRGSTNSGYLLRRLARDAPEVLERVKAGEFKSARAAAIEAGIIKPT